MSGRDAAVRSITDFVDGRPAPGSPGSYREVWDASVGRVQARVRLGGTQEVEAAVRSAVSAQPAWAATNPQRRARVLFAFKRQIEERIEELARLVSLEHGKLVADAKGEIQRGLEVVEFACGMPHLAKGEYTAGASAAIDVYSMRQPLGVVAGITPFNFPAMIPLWMIGPAVASGNAFILKPSERDPSTGVRLAELALEAGLPPGILNVVHGDRAVVDALLGHRDVQAVSFVGSSDVARHVYERASAAGKRVQAMGGAKNHAVVMPDADLDQAVPDIVGAAFGSAGERCMALPVVVAVGAGTAGELRERLVRAMRALRVGPASDPSADYGPLIDGAHRTRVERYIALGEEEGAELVVDGRGLSVPGYEGGFFLGPTLFDHVRAGMRSYEEEIFGPVLQIVRADSLDAAIALVSSHPYGNGAAIFTRDGGAAREFSLRVQAGMVGVNVPIPVPVAYYSFGGWKRSGFGDLNQYGMDGVRFYTRQKTVTQRWPGAGRHADQSLIMPTMA
jgi:malonate-semialdehyde dehydrogenase (acetylating)/methylmalonate-semialdehyde dehydrogenase